MGQAHRSAVRLVKTMSEAGQAQVVGDLSSLPTTAFGLKSVVGWGTLNFMMIEGSGFALAAAAYIYLGTQTHPWPPRGDALPSLIWSGVFTALLVLTEIPNRWLAARARKGDEKGTRLGLLLMCALGVVLTVVRGIGLAHLGVRWSDDAYGSVVWMLMILHTSHVLTDLGDSIVILVWLYTHKVGENQYSDVVDNCSYWDFVILTWVPIYLLVFWAPRL